MATGGPPAPKKKTCKRCTDLPWSVTRPHAGCIARTERLAKKVMSERASGTYVQYNGALNIWECSACVDAARVIQSAFGDTLMTRNLETTRSGGTETVTPATASTVAAILQHEHCRT